MTNHSLYQCETLWGTGLIREKDHPTPRTTVCHLTTKYKVDGVWVTQKIHTKGL